MRVIDSMLGRFREGLYIGGNLPFGLYQDGDRKIQPHPQEAPIVQLIYRLAADELLGETRIARRLNAEYPLSFRGHNWTRHMVGRVLRNRTYCGYFHMVTEVDQAEQKRREKIEQRSDLLPVLVPEEEWELVNRIRVARTHHRGAVTGRYRAGGSLLGGIVKCGECGHAMRVREYSPKHRCLNGEVHQYRLRYFHCPRGQEVRRCNNRGTASANLLEDAVLRVCGQVLPGLEVSDILAWTQGYASARRKQLDEDLSRREEELARLEGLIRRNQDLLELVRTQEEVEHYQERVRELVAQRSQVHHRMCDIRAEIPRQQCTELDVRRMAEVIRQWPARFDSAPLPARRKMLAQVLEQVIWHPQGRLIDVVFRFGDSAGGVARADGEVRFSINGVPIPKRQPHNHRAPGKPGVGVCITQEDNHG